jgi:hypothetical protein
MLECRWLARDVGVIPGFLSPAECGAHIANSEAVGYGEAPVTTASGMIMIKDLRNNDRVMVDDPATAGWLYDRLAPVLPPRVNKKWRPCGLNERLRFYRYDPGQQFDWHHDGCYARANGECSFFTFMIYLNDGFEGGATSFAELDDRVRDDDRLVVKPRQGMALIFAHPLLHKGEPVVSGRKYVLRTDVMCVRRSTDPANVNTS